MDFFTEVLSDIMGSVRTAEEEVDVEVVDAGRGEHGKTSTSEVDDITAW